MQTQQATRRAFVGGAVASVATIATIASLAREGADGAAATDGITVVDGHAPVAPATARSDWQALVGQPVQIATDTGSLPSRIREVRPLRPAGRRPADVRQHPFEVIFELDAATAPAGDRIYALARPVAGLAQLFLTRGLDVAGKTTLTALFN